MAETGIGTAIDLRATDLSEDLVRRRYQVSGTDLGGAHVTAEALSLPLRQRRPIGEVQANISRAEMPRLARALRTFEILHVLPLAGELVVGARQSW